MFARDRLVAITAILLSPLASAEVARHTTVTASLSGGTLEYSEIVADDNGNLRMEMYGADGAGNRGELRSFVVYQAAERMLLASDAGTCQAVSLDGEELPGGVTREDITAAQAEMQRALDEMRASDPEMAKMLESQMGGMAAMMGGDEPPQIHVERTGETREIEGYDTVGFEVSGVPMMDGYRVWAAEISEVEGARTISSASQGMMQAQKQMMQNMGLGEMLGNNLYNEVLDAMDNYYPIVTVDGRGTTRLVSTSGGGSDDFYPSCN
jgi:hypothetical protein